MPVARTKTQTTSGPTRTPREIESQLRRREAREKHEQFQESMILIVILSFSGVAFLGALAILAFSDKPNLQNWATTIISGIVTGYFGYWKGKQSRS